jgi:hypothetical protein
MATPNAVWFESLLANFGENPSTHLGEQGQEEKPKVPRIYSTLLTACAIWPLLLLGAGS